MIPDEDILKIINERDCKFALDKLIEVSIMNGGYDNISAILVSGEVAFN
jgi:serine/threonine protein phosphatase PrpC